MRLYVLSAYPEIAWGNYAAAWLRDSAKLDAHGKHSITEDPAEADAILFMQGHVAEDVLMERVAWHPLRRRYPTKSFLYHDCDYAFPLVPGVYPSIRAPHHRPGRSLGGVYMARLVENAAISRVAAAQVEPDLLYSFVGGNNCPVRDRILRSRVPDTHIADTSGRHAWQLDAHERAAYEDEYARICARSRFVLAPRGIGPSTYRLFEAMEMGRCPVVLSDEWVPPPFIPWDRFCIRVQESQVDELPHILADQPYQALGRAARAAWEQYVDRPHCFHYLAESLQRLLDERRAMPPERSPYAELMRSDLRNFYLRCKARGAKRKLKSLLGSRVQPN